MCHKYIPNDAQDKQLDKHISGNNYEVLLLLG